MLTLLVSLALSATAPEAGPLPVAQTNEVKPKKPKKICRSDGAIGSRLGGRTCKTAEEWKAGDDAANKQRAHERTGYGDRAM